MLVSGGSKFATDQSHSLGADSLPSASSAVTTSLCVVIARLLYASGVVQKRVRVASSVQRKRTPTSASRRTNSTERALPFCGPVTSGAGGGVTSFTFHGRRAAALTLPATSVARTRRLCQPFFETAIRTG